MLDGYMIFKNDRVEHSYGEYEKRATKILTLKKYSVSKETKIPITSLDEILPFLNKKYKLIQLDTSKGDACDIVRYVEKSDSIYLFDELTPEGKWRYKLRLTEKDCKFISFGP
jgi:hypothetical protein